MATKPPSGIVLAPQPMRSPPSRIQRVERMGLQLLEQVVDGEFGVAVVEPHDHAERDHVVAHQVDERAAELTVLRARSRSGQPHRVDHSPERPRDLPDLLHAERPDLRASLCRPNRSSATPGEWPCVPSQRMVTRAVMSDPGSKLAGGPPSRPRPLSPVRTTNTSVGNEGFSPAVSGRTSRPLPRRARPATG